MPATPAPLPPETATRLRAWALALGAALGLLGPANPGGPEALASLPTGAPVFSAPEAIDNPYLPFSEGAYKVYAGREGRFAVTVVERHLEETRTFSWNGNDVVCRIVLETSFVAGETHEQSWSYYAQADDGSVWNFGEITTAANPEAGEGEHDEESWVVGAAAPGDPEGTLSTPDPFLAMPATPETGDVWMPENIPGVLEETDRVVRDGLRLRVPAGLYEDCIQVLERSPLAPGTETKWYAAGVGAIREFSRWENVRLRATTLKAP